MLDRLRLQAGFSQRLQDGGERVQLDREVVKAATHVDACAGGTVDQFERGRRFARELQDHQASPVADFDAAQLNVAQRGVKPSERSRSVTR